MTTKPIADPAGGRNQALAEHVQAIRQLGRQTIANAVEIGRRLTECKGIVGPGNFGNWLDNEFAWSERTAQNLMRLSELSKTESANFADLNLPVSSLYLLAAPSTPEPVREEIIGRAKAGEKIQHKAVKQRVATARGPRRLITIAEVEQLGRRHGKNLVAQVIAALREMHPDLGR